MLYFQGKARRCISLYIEILRWPCICNYVLQYFKEVNVLMLISFHLSLLGPVYAVIMGKSFDV